MKSGTLRWALLAGAVAFVASAISIGSIVFANRWRFQRTLPPETMNKHWRGNVTDLTYSPDGSQIISSCCDADPGRGILLWDAQSGRIRGELSVNRERRQDVSHLRLSPDGKLLAVLPMNATIELCIWDLSDRKIAKTILREGPTFNDGFSSSCFAFSSDSAFFATITYGDTISVWDAKTFAKLRSFKTEIELPRVMAFVPGSTNLMIGGLKIGTKADGLSVLDTMTGKIIFTLDIGNYPSCMRFSPDGSRLAIGDESGVVRLVRTADWKVANRLTSGSYIEDLAFLGDDILVSAQRVDLSVKPKVHLVRSWNLDTLAEISRVRLPAAYMPSALAVSPDGKSIAVGGSWYPMFGAIYVLSCQNGKLSIQPGTDDSRLKAELTSDSQ